MARKQPDFTETLRSAMSADDVMALRERNEARRLAAIKALGEKYIRHPSRRITRVERHA
jgi:hypothetical protein